MNPLNHVRQGDLQVERAATLGVVSCFTGVRLFDIKVATTPKMIIAAPAAWSACAGT